MYTRSVKAWEKRFCARIGLIPWRNVEAAKKYMDIYPQVIEWNDAAAKETFDNAKARYWAEINSLDCDIGLPDPDIYIDADLDWDAKTDLGDYWPLDSLSETEEEEATEPVLVPLEDCNPAKCFNFGWDCAEEDELEDYTDPQRWRNQEIINKAFGRYDATSRSSQR